MQEEPQRGGRHQSREVQEVGRASGEGMGGGGGKGGFTGEVRKREGVMHRGCREGLGKGTQKVEP